MLSTVNASQTFLLALLLDDAGRDEPPEATNLSSFVPRGPRNAELVFRMAMRAVEAPTVSLGRHTPASSDHLNEERGELRVPSPPPSDVVDVELRHECIPHPSQ